VPLASLALQPAAPARATAQVIGQADTFESLTGPPIDYEFGPGNVCCIDVAAVNLLTYLERIGKLKPPSGKSPGDQQTDFHHLWDPKDEHPSGGSKEFVDAMTESLRLRKYKANIKKFLTNQLDYSTLVSEWKHGELIVLFLSDRATQAGHAVFLWSLETDLKKTPRVGVVDPNIQPNTDTHVEGETPTTVNGQPFTGGTTTGSDVTIGQDANKLPDWGITLEQPALTFGFADGSTSTVSQKTYRYRVLSFASVSDVTPTSCEPSPGPRFAPGSQAADPCSCGCTTTPEPRALPLLAGGLLALVGLGAWRGGATSATAGRAVAKDVMPAR
jgi:MYXO-CTERM domain-containing protein